MEKELREAPYCVFPREPHGRDLIESEIISQSPRLQLNSMEGELLHKAISLRLCSVAEEVWAPEPRNSFEVWHSIPGSETSNVEQDVALVRRIDRPKGTLRAGLVSFEISQKWGTLEKQCLELMAVPSVSELHEHLSPKLTSAKLPWPHSHSLQGDPNSQCLGPPYCNRAFVFT